MDLTGTTDGAILFKETFDQEMELNALVLSTELAGSLDRDKNS